jgi:hypothetical protein
MNHRHTWGYKLNTYLWRVVGRRRRLNLRETSAWVRWSSLVGLPLFALRPSREGSRRGTRRRRGASFEGIRFRYVAQRNFSFDRRGATMGVKTRYRHRHAYLCKY